MNRAGDFSTRLYDLPEGSKLLAKGPQGKFLFQEDDTHSVLIGPELLEV